MSDWPPAFAENIRRLITAYERSAIIYHFRFVNGDTGSQGHDGAYWSCHSDECLKARNRTAATESDLAVVFPA